MVDSRCGLHCTGCQWKEPCNCGGCIETQGHPFHGECPVAVCCQEKGLVHCGECPEIPCELLTQYSCDSEHGDTPPGARIEQCKKWAEEARPKAPFTFGGMNIYAKEPEKVFDFYKRLGFRVVEECASSDPYYGARLALMEDNDQATIWIWRIDGEDKIQCKNSFVFLTNGKLQEVYENIRRMGICCDPPETAVWGGQELILHDPAGNMLLFL